MEPTEVEFSLFQDGQRNSEKSQRSQLDLCVVIFRSSSTQPQIGRLVTCSKRQVKGFVGCHAMLEPGCYLVVNTAFNHWNTGKKAFCFTPFKTKFHFCQPDLVDTDDPDQYPEYVLAFHSSKRLLVEQLHPSTHLLADAIINLTLAKGEPDSFVMLFKASFVFLLIGERHEGREGMTTYYLTKGWAGLVVMVENRHQVGNDSSKCECYCHTYICTFFTGQMGSCQMWLSGKLQCCFDQRYSPHHGCCASAS